MITDKLIERIVELKNPTVAGLDPRPEYIPPYIMKKSLKKHKDPLKAVSRAIYKYNKKLIGALYDIVPAVKPQIAFYEQYGPEGIKCYIDTINYAKKKGLFVICDIKRSDIASSAQAYAAAYLGKTDAYGKGLTVFDPDFITLNPYLGYDAVLPFIENAKQYDKGLFMLVKTSNAGAGDIQDIETPSGKVYEIIADKIAGWGAGAGIGKYGYGRVGAVVGATHPCQAKGLRERMNGAFFLVPGFGAQGGTADGVRGCFDTGGMGAIINNSRGIIAAHLNPENLRKYGEKDFAAAARDAAVKMRDELGYKYESFF